MPISSGEETPFYNDQFAGASALYFSQDPPNDCNVSGGILATSDGLMTLTIFADGTPDPFEVVLTEDAGERAAWIITDGDGNILGLPAGPIFDLDGARAGSCNLYNISYDGTASLQDVGGHIANFTGCFELSNPITVIRLVGDDCETEEEVKLEGCHTPQNIKVSRRGGNRFKVSWNKVKDALNYEILVGYEGAPRSFATIPVRGRKITISSRTDRDIVFQVRSVRAGSVKSDYSAPVVLGNTKSKSNRKSNGTSNFLSPIEVSESVSFDDLTVFPNPTNGEITIKYEAKDTLVNIRIYDIQRHITKQAILHSRSVEHRIDLSTLSDGIYLMTLTEDGVQIMSERIIKTK